MSKPDSTIEVERIKMAQALAITGLGMRRLQLMAKAGEVPGAIKIWGTWTFDECALRKWLHELEEEQCRTRKAVGASQTVLPEILEWRAELLLRRDRRTRART